jgi:hypothetical protein
MLPRLIYVIFVALMYSTVVESLWQRPLVTSHIRLRAHPLGGGGGGGAAAVALAAAMTVSFQLATVEIPSVAGRGNDIVGEQIRQMAATLPNMGQPDVYYPLIFEGEWEVSQEVTGVVKSSEPGMQLQPRPLIIQGLDKTPFPVLSYKRVYSKYDAHVIYDRALSVSSFVQALIGDPAVKSVARFDPANPNLTTVDTSSGTTIEIRVTKRSVEDMSSVVNGNTMQDASQAAGAISYSEFARVVEASSSASGGGPPRIWGLRLLARYKLQQDGSIAGLERLYLYPQDTLDSGEPLEIVKSKIIMKRIG